MKVYPHARAEPGDYLDVDPINAELANLARRHNQLDRWAFANAIPRESFEIGAWGAWERFSIGTVRSVGPFTWSATQPTVVVTAPIPNGTGTPWVEDFESGDSMLEVRLLAHVKRTGGLAFYRLGVLVDSQPVALSPTHDQHEDPCASTVSAFGLVPVPAGVHLIQPVYQLWAINSAGIQLEFRDRTISVREGAR